MRIQVGGCTTGFELRQKFKDVSCCLSEGCVGMVPSCITRCSSKSVANAFGRNSIPLEGSKVDLAGSC